MMMILLSLFYFCQNNDVFVALNQNNQKSLPVKGGKLFRIVSFEFILRYTKAFHLLAG